MALNSDGPPYPEAFYLQVKQILEHFYDFPYLNRHELAKAIQLPRARSSETDGQRLRRVILAAIDDLKLFEEVEGRSIQGRFYRLLRLRYVDSNTMQEVARLLGVSERQAYRDLKRAEESLVSALWTQLGDFLDAQIRQAFVQTGSSSTNTASELQDLVLHLTNVSAGDLLKNAHKAVERLAAQQGVELEVIPFDQPIHLYTDPSLAQQILINIISSIVQNAATQRVSIQVSNAGRGLRFLFEIEQHGNQVHPQTHGSVIDMLLGRLGWQIEVDPFAVTGKTLITLRVPVQETILLVIDDNSAITELLRRFLTQTRCQVVGVDNGLEGLQMAQSLKPDAILLDVMMPNVDGWEILQRLRSHPDTGEIPVIVCSIFNDPALARSLGTPFTLEKPVKRAELLALLGQLQLI